MNPAAQDLELPGEALAPPVLYEEPVLVNPDAFVAERRRQLHQLRHIFPFVDRRPSGRRKVLCYNCLYGLHPCSDGSCPCLCKEN